MVLIRLTLNHSFNTHHLGKSQNIQKSFCADVARKVCDCVVIETANKILRKKSRAYFLLLELLFLFCEFLTQPIKYLEEKPYVGKTSIILSYFILIAAYTMYLTFYFMVLRITCLLFSYIHIQVLTLTKSRN